MTGVLLFNIRFSRMTLGLLEDTGLACVPCTECLSLTFIAVSGSLFCIYMNSHLGNLDGIKPTIVKQSHWHGGRILAADFLREVVENGFKHSNKG